MFIRLNIHHTAKHQIQTPVEQIRKVHVKTVPLYRGLVNILVEIYARIKLVFCFQTSSKSQLRGETTTIYNSIPFDKKQHQKH